MSRGGAAALIASALLMAGCSDPLEGGRPTEVRVQRIITLSGERIVSYTALYDDGVETYVDRSPIGSADLITVERDGGPKRVLVRDASGQAMPADGPDAEPIDAEWDARFAAIDRLVDADRVPWSDAHGGFTPASAGVTGPASPPVSGGPGPSSPGS
ncbi:MAG: hypothetical protein AAFR96_02835 [Planctomycetota bacterium]